MQHPMVVSGEYCLEGGTQNIYFLLYKFQYVITQKYKENKGG
jgi:hypothetical protein